MRQIWFFSLENEYYLQLRFLGPVAHFVKSDIKAVVAPTADALKNVLYPPDLIIFHRNFFPLRRVWPIIEFARKYNIPTALDVDDLITALPPEHPKYEFYKGIADEMISLYKSVDFLIVTTQRLKQEYQRHNPNIFVLPNFIDERIWNGTPPSVHSARDKIIIGYAGSATHIYDFGPVKKALHHILQRYEDVNLKFIGYMPEEFGKYSGRVFFIPQQAPYKRYAETLRKATFSIAFAPLADNTFNQCKSNLKYLEYSICGYPGIYSNVGPYKDSIKHRETGYLVENSTDAWISAFEELIEDSELRSNLAKNAFYDVKQNYTLSNKSFIWYEAYKKMLFSKSKTKTFTLDSLQYYGIYLIYAELRKIYWKFRRNFIKRG